MAKLQSPRVAWIVLKDWIRRGRPLWKLLATLAVVCLGTYFVPAEWLPYPFGATPPSLADRLRWIGMILQFAGVVVIVFSLRDNLRLFGENSMPKMFWKWLAHFRFVFIQMPPISATANMTAASADLMAGAIVTQGAKGTLEDRVAYLEQRVEENQKNHMALVMKVREHERETRNHFEAEAAERKRGFGEIETKLKTTTLGGVTLQLAGVFYLLVGIMLTSIPDGAAFVLERFGL